MITAFVYMCWNVGGHYEYFIRGEKFEDEDPGVKFVMAFIFLFSIVCGIILDIKIIESL